MFYNIILIFVKFCSPLGLNCNNLIIIPVIEDLKSSFRKTGLYKKRKLWLKL
jgi:hypothetical protein